MSRTRLRRFGGAEAISLEPNGDTKCRLERRIKRCAGESVKGKFLFEQGEFSVF
jgi:hypothetical protein